MFSIVQRITQEKKIHTQEDSLPSDSNGCITAYKFSISMICWYELASISVWQRIVSDFHLLRVYVALYLCSEMLQLVIFRMQLKKKLESKMQCLTSWVDLCATGIEAQHLCSGVKLQCAPLYQYLSPRNSVSFNNRLMPATLAFWYANNHIS